MTHLLFHKTPNLVSSEPGAAQEAGISVLIDAVASIDEAELYRQDFGQQFELVGVRSLFEARAARLSTRGIRAMNEFDIRERDELETVNLRTDLVLASASITLDNDASLEEFYTALRAKIGF
jgi:hypothetical protein